MLKIRLFIYGLLLRQRQLVRGQLFCFDVYDLSRHGNTSRVHVSHLATAHTPFDGMLDAFEGSWARTEEALHAGQRLECRSFNHIDHYHTDEGRQGVHIGRMYTYRTTHRVSHQNDCRRRLTVHGFNHFTNVRCQSIG
uniref:Putative secreted protein n=1 Tax=Anopheles darlingi TaxID=43151 RepID=A0A2M4DA26_ANODA